MKERVLPIEWLPEGRKVHRVVLHWTGGAYKVSGLDKLHYHFIIGGDGKAQRGILGPGHTLPHTRNLNSGSVGVSIACMAGAKEGGPFGKFPLLPAQYERAAQAVAEIVAVYRLAITPRTVLSHQEVTFAYGPEAPDPGPEKLRQRGKWDVSVLPWDKDLPKEEVWALFRRKVAWYQDNYYSGK